MISAQRHTATPLARATLLEGLARLWRRVRLLDVVMVTSVPLLAIVLLIGDGIVRSFQYADFDDWWTEGVNVRTLVRARASAITTLPSRVALRQNFTPGAADPGIIRLEIPQQNWQAMHRDSQAMWDEWVDGVLSYGGTSLEVRLRKRGDNSIHWLTDKRSVTVRTTRAEFYKKYREFSLSVRSVLGAYLAGRLAHEFDLLAPDIALSPVYLNNEFYGMFLLREVIDEGFLRRVGQMPGNVYRGDAAERAETYKGTPRNLFLNPYIWDRVAVNDRWTAAPADGLLRMFEDLRSGTFEAHQSLMARFDPDEYARLFAYFMLVGDPYHPSNVNNQYLYEDPSTAQLHPIAWDLRLRNVTEREPGLNDLFRALLRDPWLTDRIMHEVARSLSERRIDQVAERLLMDAETRYRQYLEYDRLRNGIVPYIGPAAQWRDMLQVNVRTMRQWLSSDMVTVGVAKSGRTRIVDLETRGLVGVDLVALEGLAPHERPRLYRDRNLNGILDAGDPEVPTRTEGQTIVLEQRLPLLAAWDTSKAGFDPGRLTYRLFVTEVGESGLRPRLVNRVTGQAPAVTELGNGQIMSLATAWHPWRYPEQQPATHSFSGEVHLSESVRIPPGDSVIVAPGTTFRLDPDVSFVSKGRVRFEGTPDRPIRIVPAVPNRPWGAFALLGPGTDGSLVRHVEFVEGGGSLVDRVEYIGMVNVHRARGVVFDSVLFLRNRRSDDTLHVLHGDVTLTNSRFVEANSDAVDFDASTGEIRGNVFDGSGGDAIDLMTSTPRIIGNSIRNAGDKGISIGEASAPFVFANLIENVVIGIQIKDQSHPVILNNEIRDSRTGLGSIFKNWRYGGSGFGFVANTLFKKNGERFDADALSRLTTVAVEGLDEHSTEAAAPASLGWLYRRYGLEIDGPTLGVPKAWRTVTPAPPLEEMRFEDDLESVADGWIGGPRVTRLEKRQGTLVVEAEGGTGTVSRDVDWDLRSGTGGVLVVELAGRDIRRVHIEAVGERGRVVRDATVPADPARFDVIELMLPPDRYSRVAVQLEPTPGLSQIQRTTGLSVLRGGRLTVRSVSAYSRHE
jgi:hypothetical protein